MVCLESGLPMQHNGVNHQLYQDPVGYTRAEDSDIANLGSCSKINLKNEYNEQCQWKLERYHLCSSSHRYVGLIMAFARNEKDF